MHSGKSPYARLHGAEPRRARRCVASVRYEDLVSTPPDTFERILAFLDIKSRSVDVDLINNLAGPGLVVRPRSTDRWKWEIAPQGEWFRPIERWRSWSAERQQELIVAGPELRGFGYETSES